jgi:hypothetical protein
MMRGMDARAEYGSKDSDTSDQKTETEAALSAPACR